MKKDRKIKSLVTISVMIVTITLLCSACFYTEEEQNQYKIIREKYLKKEFHGIIMDHRYSIYTRFSSVEINGNWIETGVKIPYNIKIFKGDSIVKESGCDSIVIYNYNGKKFS